MRAEGSHAPAPASKAGSSEYEDGERFVFGAEPIRERWWGRPLAETRGGLELARLLTDPVWRGAGVPRGDGRPIVLMPGFLAGDQTLTVMAAWLRRLGYRPRFCGFFANTGCSDRTLDRVERRVEGLWRQYGRRVALLGHSRGGHFARALAARRPDRVSHAISMGADLQGMFGASAPTLFAVRVARRVVHATGRARREACLSAHCGCPFSHDFARRFPFQHVRLTSIYSKGDGVVHWQSQVIPNADCIEVTGSHIGLIFNRKAYRALAGALALPELSPATAA
ncbi:MAG: alpha/beta hydrolase [Solirubrobacterales bacterium]|nr:alpha/beta hydrolase [Solirubrobacterales bacterium]MBV9919111.1 alpha/beta hydrolase [Solirubrobacterales bacterium]